MDKIFSWICTPHRRTLFKIFKENPDGLTLGEIYDRYNVKISAEELFHLCKMGLIQTSSTKIMIRYVRYTHPNGVESEEPVFLPVNVYTLVE